MNDGKDNAKTPAAGSGSDTLSAAKMGGNAPPSSGMAGGPGAPGTGASTGASTATGAGSGQSSALASHTSKPLGGGVGGVGAGAGLAAHSKDAQEHRSQGSSQRSGDQPYTEQAKAAASAAAESVSETAQAAGETLRQTAEAVQERAGEAYEQASQWAREKYEKAADWASDENGQRSRQFSSARRAGMQGYRQTRGGVERFVAENPIMVGVIGLAAGLLLGALLPRTRQENRAFGAWSDEVRDQGLRYAHDMAQRGREYVEEAFSEGDPRFAHHESEFRGRGGSNRSS